MIKSRVSRGKAQTPTLGMEIGSKCLVQLPECLLILIAFSRLRCLSSLRLWVSCSVTHFWEELREREVSHFLKCKASFLFEESCYFYLEDHFTQKLFKGCPQIVSLKPTLKAFRKKKKFWKAFGISSFFLQRLKGNERLDRNQN